MNNIEIDEYIGKAQQYLSMSVGRPVSGRELEGIIYCLKGAKPLKNIRTSSSREKAGILLPKITKVIFNPPATIVFWEDKTKTVVTATNEEFDKEKGLAMAISKKAYGNNYNYYNIFLKNEATNRKEDKNE